MGWERWLTPVIPALWETKWEDRLRPGVQDQPGQRGETLSLQKNIKLNWAWRHMPIMPLHPSLSDRARGCVKP